VILREFVSPRVADDQSAAWERNSATSRSYSGAAQILTPGRQAKEKAGDFSPAFRLACELLGFFDLVFLL
jgi:hypothetical protein